MAVSNSIVANSIYGIYSNSGSIALSHNNVWGNSSGDYSGVTPDANSISANPLFVSTSNFRLTGYSPARHAASMAPRTLAPCP
ncbi:hypothetical protein ACN28S_26200 [Cystobacter fuscus]